MPMGHFVQPKSPCSGPMRPGVALIVVIIVIALVTTSALTFALLMQQSNQTARLYADQQQSQWAMESALAQLECLAAMSPNRREIMSDKATLFVGSIPLKDPMGNGDDLASLGSANEDWSSDELDLDSMDSTEWSAAIDGSLLSVDPMQPGFVIFNWIASNDATSSNFTSSPAMSSAENSNPTEMGVHFGWINESSKLSLERLMQWETRGVPVAELLQSYCGLRPEQADLLLDWLDRDEQRRSFGAEATDYAQLGLRYQPANHVPGTLDSLLLVPQFTPSLLFGQQQMLTVRLPSEASPGDEDATAMSDFSRSQESQIDRDLRGLSDEVSDLVDRDGLFEFGLSSRLTVTAKERHQNRSGQLKIPINHADLQQLFAAVSSRVDPALGTYLCLARQYGLRDDETNPVGTNLRELPLAEVDLDFSRPPSNSIESLVHLMDSHVQVPQADGSRVIVRSPLRIAALDEEFSSQVLLAFDELTEEDRPVTESRLHWLLTDPQLWQWVPGLSRATQQLLVERLGTNSTGATDERETRLAYQLANWYREGRLSRQQWQILHQELTDGGAVYSANILAHAGEYRALRWGHAIIDASEKQTRQLYYRSFLPPPPALQSVMAALNETALAKP
ncbi:MAG: general secretion pathway protein GspK [Planctomycetaceae bacterium]|nr:general secretion pathway protein GspK [Planctomycetaceae bacterium]